MRKICAFLPILLHASFAFGYVTENVPNGCGLYENMNAMFIRGADCDSGYYLPANSTDCIACPTGYTCVGGIFEFDEANDQGIVINSYTCSAGYFLPANSIECIACPNGYTCAGGTFEFNSTRSSGLVGDNNYRTQNETKTCAANLPHRFFAIFEQAEQTCAPGYYLPANTNSCAQCLENNYCTGGTYNFDANNAQGISPCDIGYSSAAGASSCTPNTITINWGGANGVHATTQCTYGGDLTTPTTAPTKRGHTFTGWHFVAQQ